MKDKLILLDDFLDHLRRIEEFTIEGRDAFMEDEKTQFAVIRAYEVIGEIAKRLPSEFRDAHPKIDWHKVIGFRDFLAHNYEEIIIEFVWAAVADVPNLRLAVQTARNSLAE